MKLRILLLVVICLFASRNYAQEDRYRNFIGINPSFTVEPFYEDGEFDVNVLPLVYQRPINARFDVRFTTILSYGFRNVGGDQLNAYGFEVASPIFMKKKENRQDLSKGFYIAPIFSFNRYTVEQHDNFGLWLEPGFNFPLKKRFSLSTGLQVGATYFAHSSKDNEWKEHIGVKVVIGYWIN